MRKRKPLALAGIGLTAITMFLLTPVIPPRARGMREHASRAGGFDHGIRHPVAVQLRLQQIPDVHGHDAGHEARHLRLLQRLYRSGHVLRLGAR